MDGQKEYRKDRQRVIKHFRIKQKCERKHYLLKTITSHNQEKGIKREKFAPIPFLSLSFLFILFLFYSFWFLLAVFFGQGKFFFKLTQQGDDCVFKDFYAISFYAAQYVRWTDSGRSFHYSTGGFQAAKRRVMGIRLESLQGASYLRSQLWQIVDDASCCLAGAVEHISQLTIDKAQLMHTPTVCLLQQAFAGCFGI